MQVYLERWCAFQIAAGLLIAPHPGATATAYRFPDVAAAESRAATKAQPATWTIPAVDQPKSSFRSPQKMAGKRGPYIEHTTSKVASITSSCNRAFSRISTAGPCLMKRLLFEGRRLSP